MTEETPPVDLVKSTIDPKVRRLVGRTVKLPGIDAAVTVLSVHTCDHDGCNQTVLLIRPRKGERPFPVHEAGYREVAPQADKTEGGRHHADR